MSCQADIFIPEQCFCLHSSVCLCVALFFFLVMESIAEHIQTYSPEIQIIESNPCTIFKKQTFYSDLLLKALLLLSFQLGQADVELGW